MMFNFARYYSTTTERLEIKTACMDEKSSSRNNIERVIQVKKGLRQLLSLINDAGYVQGNSEDFDRDHALDWNKLSSFLSETQKKSTLKPMGVSLVLLSQN